MSKAIRATKKPKALVSEHDHQVALVEACQGTAWELPELALLVAIPNGGARNAVTGAMLKREGVRAGFPDLFLPVARGGYHGLFIELKLPSREPKTARGKGGVSDEQREWLDTLNAQGYRAVVCYGATKAFMELRSYLTLKSVKK